MKDYIKGYIDMYLENDDEFTRKNEEKFLKIQQNNEILSLIENKIKGIDDYSLINEIIDKTLNEIEL